MIGPSSRKGVISLAVGAVSAALLISCYAMFWYEIPVGRAPQWVVEVENFIKVFPWALLCASAVFFIAGPVLYILLRKLHLYTWWGTAFAGGLVAFTLTFFFNSSFSILVHPIYFLMGALSALLSFLMNMRSNKLD